MCVCDPWGCRRTKPSLCEVCVCVWARLDHDRESVHAPSCENGCVDLLMVVGDVDSTVSQPGVTSAERPGQPLEGPELLLNVVSEAQL